MGHRLQHCIKILIVRSKPMAPIATILLSNLRQICTIDTLVMVEGQMATMTAMW